jgi:hypothetical protein
MNSTAAAQRIATEIRADVLYRGVDAKTAGTEAASEHVHLGTQLGRFLETLEDAQYVRLINKVAREARK